ncbi:MAG TPA: hypothetical protein VLC06_13110 [Polyangia bacterium]|nr:hypothetical protein [Polyangia bacterium]
MFRLFKLGVALIGFAAFAWFGVTVKLGSQTLFQHLRAISQTKESQELVDGTRQAAGPLADDVRRRFQEGTARTADKHSPDAGAGPPEERVSAADRQALHHLIRRVDR